MARTREEQIASCAVSICEFECVKLPAARKIARYIIEEAEQRGYERARAECAEDTRRLDWLEKVAVNAEDVEIHCSMNTSGETSFGVCGSGNYEETLRSAIDAAMKEAGQ